MKAIEATIERTGIDRKKLMSMLYHFFIWQRGSFSKAEYVCYLWPKFGTFSYFNKINKKERVKEVDDYFNGRLHKDKRRKLSNVEYTPEKERLVKEITKNSPTEVHSSLQDEFVNLYWILKGECGWNEQTMFTLTAKELKRVLELINNGKDGLQKQTGSI